MATKNKKVNRAWLNDHLNDPYVKMAQRDGYRARAAYKLKEINEALGLLRPGQLVVDLGSAPGAWSQYLRRTFPDSTVIALDILPMEPIDQVTFIQGDFREDGILQQLHEAVKGRPVDVVVSDMAPNLSGIATSDAARISHLVELAMDFSASHLTPKGALVVKVFHGSGYSQIVEEFKRHFLAVKAFKPQSSRARSAETFLIGLGLKGSR